jgi:hypothetical protein
MPTNLATVLAACAVLAHGTLYLMFHSGAYIRKIRPTADILKGEDKKRGNVKEERRKQKEKRANVKEEGRKTKRTIEVILVIKCERAKLKGK